MRNRVLIAAIAVLVIAFVIFWYSRRTGEAPIAVDLLEQFQTAEKRSTLPAEQAFSITDVTIAGESNRALFAHPTSRVIWKVTVPNDASLRAALGIKPDAWDKEGDGVLFRIGISDGRTYEELLNQHVNPAQVEGDRKWVPVNIDLSAYAGEEVEIIFNTNSSLPGRGDDSRHDWALWATPRIVVRP
jgi:hypothetical protein